MAAGRGVGVERDSQPRRSVGTGIRPRLADVAAHASALPRTVELMSERPLADTRLAVIGVGAMGEAMVAGLVDRRLVDPSHVTCSHPRAERREALASSHGVSVTADNVAAARGADIVLLAVKPQMLAGVMAELRGTLAADQL